MIVDTLTSANAALATAMESFRSITMSNMNSAEIASKTYTTAAIAFQAFVTAIVFNQTESRTVLSNTTFGTQFSITSATIQAIRTNAVASDLSLALSAEILVSARCCSRAEVIRERESYVHSGGG